jgi:DNA-binding MarR family transcriptional regulator
VASDPLAIHFVMATQRAAMNDSPDSDAERLIQLSEEVSRIASSLGQLAIGLGAPFQRHPPATNSNEPSVPVETVTWLIRARRNRAQYLDAKLFAEPAWDILLDLLRAELAQEQVSVSSACIAAGVPASTSLRWLNTLEQEGLVLRKSDPRDARRAFVVLSPETSTALRRYFLDVVGARATDQRGAV